MAKFKMNFTWKDAHSAQCTVDAKDEKDAGDQIKRMFRASPHPFVNHPAVVEAGIEVIIDKSEKIA